MSLSPVRVAFPYVLVLVAFLAVVAAVTLGTLPPADLTFSNGTEVQTVDPHRATGVPENRVVSSMFEGLLRTIPSDEPPNEPGIVPMTTAPGVAESYSISDDGKVYTFHLRPTARWSNGRRVTADDFVWSWRRCLHPETTAKYAYQLYYVAGAENYNHSQVEIDDRVEVELPDRPDSLQPFPRGTIVRGVLKQQIKPPEPNELSDKSLSDDARGKVRERWKRAWIHEVEANGELRRFAQSPPDDAERVETCLHLLPDFEATVGVRADGEDTLVVTLVNRTAFFPSLVAFYTLFPVNRECVEQFGTPRWTKPQHIVTNGPYRLEFRRLRDRIRLAKNPQYWDADRVRLNTVDALAVSSDTTALNMYLNGQVDWITSAPRTMIYELKQRDDFRGAPQLSCEFYRVNVTRKPLDNVLVRRALNLAIDKRQLCEHVTRAGEQPARSLVPPGLAGYQNALCGDFDVAQAKRLLAEAGYPDGTGLPKLEILYNTNDNHRDNAQVIAQNWKEHLGVAVELRNLEWGVYLSTQEQKDYIVARSGWVGDYPDPNTFLDMFLTGGGQNQTGWSNPQYDRLIEQAATEADPARRLELLHDAETILMDELPIIPLYFSVSINMVHPRVKHFQRNILNQHPLSLLDVEPR